MRILILSLLVLTVDQVSKFLVRMHLEYAKPYDLIGQSLRLRFIENPGMAFGIQFGGQLFFVALASLAVVAVFTYVARARNQRFLLRAALALILGGAAGNLIDRLLYGKVVDFIEIRAGSFAWPIFNIADLAVTTGMLALAGLILFDAPGRRRTGKASDDAIGHTQLP